jgi:membrane associated rhomboid family serine protease
MHLGGFSTITLWIIAAIVAASIAAFQNPRLKTAWMLKPYMLTRDGNYYTLISSGFIHVDWPHLIFNCMTLYFFGTSLENYYELGLDMSGVWILWLFLSGVIIASLPSAYRYRKEPSYATLGASGGVSAVLFASILIDPFTNVCFYGVLCLPGIVAGALYLAYSYYQSQHGRDNINHEAHLAGAVYGLLWQTFITPSAWTQLVSAIADLMA